MLRSHYGIPEGDFGEFMLVGIANNQAHAWKCGDLFRGALRIASGDDDAGIGILPANSTNCGASVLVRSRCYGAGIQHYDRCITRRGGAGIASLLELAFEGCAICLRSAAAEVFYEESGHTLCYRTA